MSDFKPLLDLTKKNEGFSEKAYQSKLGGGKIDVPTIGYGHTGPDVKMGMTMSKSEAEKILG